MSTLEALQPNASVRGDLQRCLVVCPGSLAEQWQDELYRRFQLPFDILTNDKLEAARTGNWFLEQNLIIARLDKLSRNEDVQQKLQTPDCHWDLVVCDEAHKLSATFFGGEIRYTRRYKLGQLLAPLTRHFLLMTATPHNGKEEDFQLFLALLDGDRFEGRFRDGVHQVEVSDHLQDVRGRRLEWIDKTRAAVKDRLTKEIGYWDHRAEELKLQEQAGRTNARLNSQEARRRADELQARLQKRMEQLDLEAQISALLPVALGGLVVPAGLLAQTTGHTLPEPSQPADTQAVAARARAIVMDVERQLGYEPVDREFEKLGYDIESRDPRTSRLRFLEVKGRVSGAATITVTKNEILYSLNKPEDFILAIVEFMADSSHCVHYVRRPFRREPDFGVTSVNYDFAELLAKVEAPR
jgi:Protein NO VEIN, C-terminal/SNF2-related domain